MVCSTDALPATLLSPGSVCSRMPDTAETRLRQGEDATIAWAVAVEATREEEAGPIAEILLPAKPGRLETYRLLCSLGHDPAAAGRAGN